MFTLQQIQELHSKVKSGADFPRYIQDLIEIGLKKYDMFVYDGRAQYFWDEEFTITSDSKYPGIIVSDAANHEQFEHDLKAHQRGETDYMTLINDAAKSGIYKRTVDMQNMMCVYYDQKWEEVLAEEIPGV